MTRADKDLAFMLRYENVAWYDSGRVRILDRRIYPLRTLYVECGRYEEVAQAIAGMVTQSGGPYTAAAMGMVLAAHTAGERRGDELLQYLGQAARVLSSARPTTAKKMEKVVNGSLEAAARAVEQGEDVESALFDHAVRELDRRYEKSALTARHLVDKIPDGGTVMTQCFAETIVGTMLRECRRRGKEVKVICPETRPYLQGARLTASVVRDMGFDVTVITDNMPGYVMKSRKVDLFTSAADVICMDGHIVNKIGTFQIALVAKHWGVPYYVTGAPDPEHKTMDTVEIEERDPELVLDFMGTRVAMKGVKGYYPAFDITPPELCAGVVTDKGVFSPTGLQLYYTS
jgi:methylthioribose-1-phosphate isomerase